jgi:flagellar motor switch protein FliG
VPEQRIPLTVSNKQKAAILLVALGPDVSSQVLKHLKPDEVEDLTLEVARMGTVAPEVRQAVIQEFGRLVMAPEYVTEGGVGHAREMLEKAFGTEKAEDMIGKAVETLNVLPFDTVKKTDASQLLSLIANEHPQTIALILAFLQPNQAAQILSGLPPDLSTDVATRLAQMDRTTPEVIRDVERVLERKLATLVTSDLSTAGGVKSLVEVLNWTDRATEKNILEGLTESNPELAEEVKNMMFTFDDIVKLDDRAVQQVLREIDTKELALALKVCSEEVKQKVTKNMSERAATMLQEDMEFMGPVRLRNVEEAQQRIVNVIRKLEEAGEIIISRGGEDEVLV